MLRYENIDFDFFRKNKKNFFFYFVVLFFPRFVHHRVSSMPIDIEKPATRKQPLRRGIHITENKDYRVNPEPLVLQEADFLLEEFLSPTKLVSISSRRFVVDIVYSRKR